MDNLVIRLIDKNDYQVVSELVKDCFWDLYRPGAVEHKLLDALRKTDKYDPRMEFVLELDGKIIGSNIFYPGVVNTPNGDVVALTMGPVCIAKEHQKKGYGKYIVDGTIELIKYLGYGAILIEGDYNFYSKCGFTYARQYGIKYFGLPEDMDDSFFLALEIKPDYLKDIGGSYESPYSDVDI